MHARWLFLLALTPLLAQAQEGAATYGDVYMVTEKKVDAWDLGLDFGRNFSNPFFTLYGLGPTLRWRHPTKPLLFGASYTRFFSSQDSFVQQIAISGATVGLETHLNPPRHRFRVEAGAVPIAGILNLFEKRIVPFEVQVLGRVSWLRYQEAGAKSWALGAALTYPMSFWKNFYFAPTLGFDYEFSKSEDLGGGSTEVSLLTSWRF